MHYQRYIFDLENYKLQDLILREFGKDCDVLEILEGVVACYLERTLYLNLSGNLSWKVRNLGVPFAHRAVRLIEGKGVIDYTAFAKTLSECTTLRSVRSVSDRTIIIIAE